MNLEKDSAKYGLVNIGDSLWLEGDLFLQYFDADGFPTSFYIFRDDTATLELPKEFILKAITVYNCIAGTETRQEWVTEKGLPRHFTKEAIATEILKT